MSLKSEIIIECNACHVCDGELYEGWRVGCDDLVFRSGAEEALKVKEEEIRKKDMKTLKQWEKSGLDLEDFIQPGDWINEDLYNYIGEIICPYYCSRDFIQGGDPVKSENGVLFYYTCHHTDDDRYLYLGILPEFK